MDISSRPSKKGAFAAIIAGGLGFVAFRIWPISLPREFSSLLLAFVFYWVGSFLENQFWLAPFKGGLKNEPQ